MVSVRSRKKVGVTRTRPQGGKEKVEVLALVGRMKRDVVERWPSPNLSEIAPAHLVCDLELPELPPRIQ